ncbi:MAG: orotidine-5'-phosphate decarboxylase [Flavobacteriales bacterium]|nr:orotidine-5'-phosphate decarboxylase [Flavobacteriales bacterium]
MTRQELYDKIIERRSFLCVGLDTDPKLLPLGVDMLSFNKAIIDATRDYCVAYKPNLAFYEKHGVEGWRVLDETIQYIGKEHFIIADAKRGDIGNTSSYYASTFFETLGCDAVTIAPYMGRDSVEPFLKFPGKWAIALALTSNPGATDFQTIKTSTGRPLYQDVIASLCDYGTPDNLMFVVGATRAEMLGEIRSIAPDHFLLVPGVGAQGGSLSEVAKYGMNKQCGILVNASRSILYASRESDFALAAAIEAKKIQVEMSGLL